MGLLDGLFTVLGKVANYTQGREERRRNERDTLLKKIDDLKKQPATVVNRTLMQRYTKRLSEIEKNAINS